METFGQGIINEPIFEIQALTELHVIDEEMGDEADTVEQNCEEGDRAGEMGMAVGLDDSWEGALDEGEGGEAENDECEVPVVGMVFESLQSIENFYLKYANSTGFGVIRRGAHCNRTTKVKKLQYWNCDRGPPVKGKSYSPEVKGPASRSRKSKKCGCGARMSGFLNEDGLWEIKEVELTHTRHVPEPAHSRFIPCWRNVPKHLLRFVHDLIDAGVTQSQIYVALANQLNGFDKVPFLLKDLANAVTKERCRKLKEGDCEAMFDYFGRMEEMNSDFHYKTRIDSNDRLTDILWVDARSRAAYKDFCDVVCFDATYITNNYELPFANFVGVNHHGQTILLGCALISHEDTDSYKWVMEEWLKAMDGKAPGGIITDQSTPMRQAIEAVMPGTRHRLCVWHILKKIPTKFVKFKRVKEFHKHMRCVVYDSLSILEFEHRWNEMIFEFGLSQNPWLLSLYNDRKHWVPAFVKDQFWAGMSTTQRVESIHHFFKGFMNSKTTLREFVAKYTRAIDHRTNAEQIADSIDERRRPKLVTHLMVEKFYAETYTHSKLKEVQDECQGLIHCVPLSCKQNTAGFFEYLIHDRVWVGEPEVMVQRNHEVIYDKVNEEFFCDCRLFECRGVLCRHVIRVMDMLQLKTVPPKYVLDRWKKGLVREHVGIKVDFNDPMKTAADLRYGKLQYQYEKLFKIAMQREDLCAHAIEAAEGLCEELLGLRGGSDMGGNTHTGTDSEQPSTENPVGAQKQRKRNRNSGTDGILAPLPVKRNGRPRNNKNPPRQNPPSKKTSISNTSTDSSVNQPAPQNNRVHVPENNIPGRLSEGTVTAEGGGVQCHYVAKTVSKGIVSSASHGEAMNVHPPIVNLNLNLGFNTEDPPQLQPDSQDHSTLEWMQGDSSDMAQIYHAKAWMLHSFMSQPEP